MFQSTAGQPLPEEGRMRGVQLFVVAPPGSGGRVAENPAALTKPAEYKTLRGWEPTNLDPLLAAMAKSDFAAFDAQYRKVITACDACHDGLGYPMVKFVLPPQPVEPQLNYTLKTKATDFKDFKPPSGTSTS